MTLGVDSSEAIRAPAPMATSSTTAREPSRNQLPRVSVTGTSFWKAKVIASKANTMLAMNVSCMRSVHRRFAEEDGQRPEELGVLLILEKAAHLGRIGAHLLHRLARLLARAF